MEGSHQALRPRAARRSIGEELPEKGPNSGLEDPKNQGSPSRFLLHNLGESLLPLNAILSSQVGTKAPVLGTSAGTACLLDPKMHL